MLLDMVVPLQLFPVSHPGWNNGMGSRKCLENRRNIQVGKDSEVICFPLGKALEIVMESWNDLGWKGL